MDLSGPYFHLLTDTKRLKIGKCPFTHKILAYFTLLPETIPQLRKKKSVLKNSRTWATKKEISI